MIIICFAKKDELAERYVFCFSTLLFGLDAAENDTTAYQHDLHNVRMVRVGCSKEFFSSHVLAKRYLSIFFFHLFLGVGACSSFSSCSLIGEFSIGEDLAESCS